MNTIEKKITKIMKFGYLLFLFTSFLCISVNGQNKNTRPQTNKETLSKNTLTSRQIATKVFKSLVVVLTQDADGNPLSQGSGFFFQIPKSLIKVNDGAYQPFELNQKTKLVVSNLHVFKRAWQGYIKTLQDNKLYKIKKVIGIDVKHDLCVFEVEGIYNAPLLIGDSDKLAVGDDIFVSGNPKGLEGSFSKGIISSIRKNQGLLQIDAAISSGSSGGPVVNSLGDVIGIAVSSLVSGQNLNFAVPSNYLINLPLTWETNVNSTGAIAITDKENERLIGSVKSVIVSESEFILDDDDEMPIEQKPKFISKQIYNEDSAKTYSATYENDGSVSLEILITYDERGMRSKADINLVGKGRKIKTFTDQENLELKLKTRDYNITKNEEYDAIGGIKVKRAVTYDTYGNEIEDERLSSDGTQIKIISKYDGENKLIEQLEYRNNKLIYQNTYKYKFDGYGNWIKKTKIISSPENPEYGKLPVKSTYREIKYY